MQTGVGQCHSMPLYYLVLAEEMGAEAYWSFSPNMNSSYIKSEALQNKIYLEPMDKTNVVAEMLVELARYYYQKYGLDDFYLKCINTAQQYLDNDINVKIMKSAYQTRLTLTIIHLLNDPPPPDILKEVYPEIYKHYELMLAQYQEIDNMGYEEVPVSIYSLWLDHIAKEKGKADKAKMPSIFLNTRKE